MRIVSWNVNGIRAVHRKGLFLPFLEKLQPDIICLQETKAEQHQSEIDLPDYEEYWNSAEKKGYSGTAIFSKIKPMSILLDFSPEIIEKYKIADDGYGNPASEGRVITAEFSKFFLVNVYTPNAKDDLGRLTLRYKTWDPAFLAHCQKLREKKPVIFCGDLNVAHTSLDLTHAKQNEGKKGYTKEERSGIDLMIQTGFVDSFRLFTTEGGHYTWWSHFANARARNVGWRIDYFFVSKELISQVIGATIHPEVHGSDHCPISLDVKD